MNDPVIDLHVTPSEAQTIINGLGELQHKYVGALSLKLQAQAQEQLDKLAREQIGAKREPLPPLPDIALDQSIGTGNGVATSEI